MATKSTRRRKRGTSAASSGRPLKAAAIMAGGIVGVLLAVKAFSGPPEDKYAEERETPSRLPRKKAAVGAEVLEEGQKSERVKNVQKALVAMGGEPARIIQQAGGADGSYGPATKRALKAAGIANPAMVSPAEYKNLLNKAAAKAVATIRPNVIQRAKGGLMKFLGPKTGPGKMEKFLSADNPKLGVKSLPYKPAKLGIQRLAQPSVTARQLATRPKPTGQIVTQRVMQNGKSVVKAVVVAAPTKPVTAIKIAARPFIKAKPVTAIKIAARPLIKGKPVKFAPVRTPGVRPQGIISI